jgi:serine/threonine-protein kinase
MTDGSIHATDLAGAGTKGNGATGDKTVLSGPSAAAGRVAPARGMLPPGHVLGNTYEIETLLARGGMGEVYRARHLELGSAHAIKVILSELAEDARIITLFQEEARKLRRLRADAIVAYEGLFRDENGARYLVMEFIDGPSLADRMHEKPLDVEAVRALRDRCASGLAAAHDKGVFHRDISPDNIILVDGHVEQAKIIDFGIAKSVNAGDKTVVGTDFAGKYSYVSPEQLGMRGGAVDGRSDIYSLGLVLTAAFRGKPLDMGNSPASAVEARQCVPDLDGMPATLRAEIEPLLAPDPANRPASMAELPGLRIAITTGTHGTSPPRPAARQGGQPRRFLVAAALVIVAAAAGAFAMAGLRTMNTAPSAPSPAPVAVAAPRLPPEPAAVSPPQAVPVTPPAISSPVPSGPVDTPAVAGLPAATPSAPAVAPLPTPAAMPVSVVPTAVAPPQAAPAAPSSVPPTPAVETTVPKSKPATPPKTQATIVAQPKSAPAQAKKPGGARCNAILEQVQLGEALDDEERAYLKERCQ